MAPLPLEVALLGTAHTMQLVVSQQVDWMGLMYLELSSFLSCASTENKARSLNVSPGVYTSIVMYATDRFNLDAQMY